MLLKIINRTWLRYFIVLLVYIFYSQTSYASCIGLGCSCTVATTAVAFGNYNPISAVATTATGNVAVTCNALVLFTVSYVISMNAGNSGSFIPTRFMNLLGVHLNYNLYTTASNTSVWGDGTAGTSTVSDAYTAILLPSIRNYTVYGLLPALQAVGAGTYTDTVTVTVTY
jgi:spore coat protein U-like protein